MKKIMSLTALLLAGVTAAASAQGFAFQKNIDPMDDQDHSLIFTLSDDQKSSIAWVCGTDGLGVGFVFNRYLIGHGSFIRVAHRFAPSVASVAPWAMTTNHRGALLPMNQVYSFTVQALQQPRVVLRVTDEDGDSVTAKFDLSGLREGLGQLPCALGRQFW